MRIDPGDVQKLIYPISGLQKRSEAQRNEIFAAPLVDYLLENPQPRMGSFRSAEYNEQVRGHVKLNTLRD